MKCGREVVMLEKVATVKERKKGRGLGIFKQWSLVGVLSWSYKWRTEF